MGREGKKGEGGRLKEGGREALLGKAISDRGEREREQGMERRG